MFSGQNIPPQQTSKRRAEGSAECSVVDTQGHAVYRAPEGPTADGNAVARMYFLPCLYDTGEKDGGADIRAGKLYCHGATG